MQINLTVFATGTTIINNILRITAAEESTPNAIVATQEYAPPQVFPRNVTLDVPNPVVHRVRIYSSPDASPGTLLSEFIYDPTYQNIEIKLPVEIEVGAGGAYDPGANSNSIDLSDFAAYDWYPMRRAAAGMMSVNEYTKSPDNKTLNLVGDDQFSDGEYIWIFFSPKVTTAVPTIIQAALYRGVKIIRTNTLINASFSGFVISVVGPDANAITLTLDALSSVSDFTPFDIDTMDWTNYQITIKVTGGDRIRWNGQDMSEIYLGAGEDVRIVKFPAMSGYPNGYWKVTAGAAGMFLVGDSVDHERVLNAGQNGRVQEYDGQPLLVANWPRVKWMVNTFLAPGAIIQLSTRTTDALKGFWAVDSSDATRIWKPERRGTFKRAMPGDRGNDSDRTSDSFSGSYGADKLENHRHDALNNSGQSDPVNSFFMTYTTAPGPTGTRSDNNSGTTRLGRLPTTGDVHESVSTDIETSVKNIGYYMGFYS